MIIKTVKSTVKTLPSLALDNLEAFKIVKIDTSDIGYSGILRQSNDIHEILARHTSRNWSINQHIHSIIKKEILSIVLCISKFQNGLLNKKLLRVDCKSAKLVLQKDIKNITSKHNFARWQAILSNFDFQNEYIKGENNLIPDCLTREFCRIHEIMASSSSFSQEDSYAESDDSTSNYLPDNDCEGILPPIRKSK